MNQVHVHNVGRNQAEFIEVFGTQVLPNLRLAWQLRPDLELSLTAPGGSDVGDSGHGEQPPQAAIQLASGTAFRWSSVHKSSRGLRLIGPLFAVGEKMQLQYNIQNTHRAIGTRLSAMITRKFGMYSACVPHT